jgi:hypothetical protein
MLPLFVAWALALNPKGRATSAAPSTDDGLRGATLDSRALPDGCDEKAHKPFSCPGGQERIRSGEAISVSRFISR